MNLRHETQRLTFLERRDGPVEAKNFARRTLATYKAALKKNKQGSRSGYGKAYRKTLIESCLDFRTYIRSREYLSTNYNDRPTLTELINKFGNQPVPETLGKAFENEEGPATVQLAGTEGQV